MESLKIIKSTYFDFYNKKQLITLLKHFNKLKAIDINQQNFGFYFSNAAVYSSMIEGNRIDFDSYLRFSETGMNNKGKSFVEIEDLIESYKHAQNNKLDLSNFLEAHKILTQTILEDKKYQGKIRDKDVFVFKDGVKIFTGCSAQILEEELNCFFDEIGELINKTLTISEVFYYAAMIHLCFVQIHPFADGNGRAARLLEKWFLAEKLGSNAWFIQSEQLYQKRIKSYYKNVNIGNDYSNIDYDLCLPFLLMLPMALKLHV